MRLITARTIRQFAEEHADAAQALSDWCAQVQAARWCTPVEMEQSMPGSEYLGTERAKFRICGNRYRIVADIRFADREGQWNGIVRVQFIGTHAEYDRVDALTVSLPSTKTRSRS